MANTMCLGGTYFIKCNGKTLMASTDSMTVPLTDETRTSQISTSGTAGYTAVPRVPFIECTCYFTPDFDLEIFKQDGLTVEAQFNNGKTYSLTNAWVANDVDFDGTKGTCTIRFEGKKGKFI